jgi:uncharacterized Zn-finger protein
MELVTVKDLIIPGIQALGVIAIAAISIFKPAADAKKINKLKEENRMLKEIPLTYENGCWYDNNKIPFCPACRGSVPPMFIPLKVFINYDGKSKEHHCPKCKEVYSFFSVL